MDQEEIDDLVEELTTTGKDELEKEPIQVLYNLCRRSKENLEFAYSNVYAQLQQNHSEIRYSAFQIIDKLFMRSHSFRILVLDDLSNIFVLSMETDYPEQRLPPPASTAEKLKKLGLRRFFTWYKRFGKGYRLLELGFDYLSNVKQVKFNRMEIQTHMEQKADQYLKDQKKVLRRCRLDQVDMQFEDRKAGFLSDCREMENCFEMLVRRFPTVKDTDDIDNTNDNEDDDDELPEEPIGNESGITPHTFTLELEIPRKQIVYETPDNEDIIRRIRELHKENQRHVEDTKLWLNTLTKCGCTNGSRIDEILALKNTLDGLLNKFNDLDIREELYSSDEEEDGEEFVEVPEKLPRFEIEEVEEETVSEKVTTNSKKVDRKSLPSSVAAVVDSEQPTCSRYLDNDNRNKGDFSSLSASSSKREQHLARAPFVPFDTDLKYWEESKVEMASSYKTDSLHRFWKTNEHQESFVPAQVASSMRERCLRLDTEFVPVTQKCDAPMPDGRRCERMDREKCPFHGKIVERDASGKPVHKDDIERDKQLQKQKAEIEKLKIQREIESKIGFSFTYQKGKRRRRRNNVHPSHMSRKERRNFRYERLTKVKVNEKGGKKDALKKKVFSVRSMDKISKMNNQKSRSKHEEQFGSNFNY